MELYVHIPFCVKKCDYCDFLSFPTGCADTQDYGPADEYVDSICRELGALSGLPDFSNEKKSEWLADTVFIGGGTPSVLSIGQMERILKCIDKLRSKKPGAEYTIETNPGTLNEEKLRLYKSYGINRLSIGLQSTENPRLKALGRIHSFEQFLDNYRLARRLGFENINIDLISAIPGQTAAEWERTVRTVAELEPEHISAYSLILEPGTALFKRYEDNPLSLQLPDEDEEREMYHITARVLSEYGYKRYEISNYAKPGFECRHNLGYWQGEEYIACGQGASSYLKTDRYKSYRKGFIMDEKCSEDVDKKILYDTVNSDINANSADYIRFSNTRLSAEYNGIMKGVKTVMVEELLDREARMAEFCILGLRLVSGINISKFEQKFTCSFDEKYGAIVRKYTAAGFMKNIGGNLCLTEKGFDVSNSIMTEFL
ncbi:MAG: radical SAM family heme chaperone HemW [Lachnospiraceae bacterium]|nr:radical SAM family heme chaperone HemW [Lachnospiraceae bacterium]